MNLTTMNRGTALFSAELHAQPGPRPDDGVFHLRWEIAPSSPVDCPAGHAVLHVPGGSVRAIFDYAAPGVLVGVTVPFGSVTIDEGDDDLWRALVERGRLTEIDAQILEQLFGGDFVDQLHRSNLFTAPIAARDSWAAMGRVAAAQTMLRRTATPIDGLWALELGLCIGEMAETASQRRWARETMARSVPALRLLDESWQQRLPEQQLALLHRLFARARSLDPALETGPLAAVLNASAEAGILAELETLMSDADLLDPLAAFETVPLTMDFQLKSHTESGPEIVMRGGTTAAERREQGAVLVDDDARKLGINGGTWQLIFPEKGATTIQVRLDRQDRFPAALQEDTTVLVSADGRLLAVGAGLAPDPSNPTRLITELALLERPIGDVAVVVGRDLPIGAMDSASFERRRLERQRQAAVDHRRVAAFGPGGASGAMEPFVVELLADWWDDEFGPSEPVVSDVDVNDLTALAGARSLALTFGAEAEAARWEARRRELQRRLADLDIPVLERLAGAAVVQADDRATAQILADAREAELDERP